MSTDTALTSRQKLIDMLCGDLNAQGWNQNNKIWFVKGNKEDEWLEFAGEFSGAPEHHLVDLIAKDEPRADVTGVVVSTEGWAYPKKLAETFKSQAALRAYWRLVPPSEHPDKIEIRHVLFASNDGEVIGLTYHRDAGHTQEWAMIDADKKCPTGDHSVDAARALLGINDELKRRILKGAERKRKADQLVSGLDELNEQLQTMLGTFRQAMDGEITQAEATLKLFHTLSEEQRVDLLKQMPTSIIDELRGLLTDEERKKYKI